MGQSSPAGQHGFALYGSAYLIMESNDIGNVDPLTLAVVFVARW
jgi:hypothetical protein